MTLHIDADCALAYWMSSAAGRGAVKRASHETLMERFQSGNLPDWAYGNDMRLHVVAEGKRAFVNRKGLYCRVVMSSLPNASFVFTDTGLPIVSPEYCFLRLASVLSLPELAKVGSLLCAAFSFDEAGCLMERCDPIVSTNTLRRYIKAAGSMKGVVRARRALQFVAAGAASPPEIDATLLLCLPPMHGGYGCPMPEPNGHVRLNPVIARSLGYADCYGDLLWRDAKCIVEYTSEQHHTGYRKQARDEIRRAALEAMGYRVFLLTKPQLHNQVAFEGFARAVLRAIGKRMPRRSLEHQSAQYELRKSLLFEPSWAIAHACHDRVGEL